MHTYVGFFLVKEREGFSRGWLSQVVGDGGRVGLEELRQPGHVHVVVVVEVAPPTARGRGDKRQEESMIVEEP